MWLLLHFAKSIARVDCRPIGWILRSVGTEQSNRNKGMELIQLRVEDLLHVV